MDREGGKGIRVKLFSVTTCTILYIVCFQPNHLFCSLLAHTCSFSTLYIVVEQPSETPVNRPTADE